MPRGMGNPNSRFALAEEAAWEDFEDALSARDAEASMEALRDALTIVLESNSLENRYDAAVDIVNILNPDAEFGGAKEIERACDNARAAIQERMP